MRRWENGVIFQYFRYYNISLTSAPLYTFASFTSPFCLLDYFPLLTWLLWPLHYHTCCSIKITNNSADVSLIKILEEKERLIVANELVSLKPAAHLSSNELLRDWSCREVICSIVVCFVGGGCSIKHFICRTSWKFLDNTMRRLVLCQVHSKRNWGAGDLRKHFHVTYPRGHVHYLKPFLADPKAHALNQYQLSF